MYCYDDGYELIENTKKAMDEYGHRYGSEQITITRKELKELEAGKLLAFSVSAEHVAFVGVEKKKTRLDVLKEQYPNFECDEDGFPTELCVRQLYGENAIDDNECKNVLDCVKCWNTPIKDGE